MTFEFYNNSYLETYGSGSDWRISFRRCKRQPLSFFDECVLSAQKIADISPGKIQLLASGGRDSLFAIKVFKEAKVSFEAVVMSWGDLNSHDTKHAYDYCRSLNINVQTVDFDIISYIKSGKLLDKAHELGIWAHQIPPILECVERLDGLPVVCGGDPMLKFLCGCKWVYFDLEVLNSFSKYFSNYSIKGIPEFYRYSPEQFLAFFKEKEITELINMKHSSILNSRNSKYRVYEKYMEIKFEFPKYDGWEVICSSDFKYKSDVDDLLLNLSPFKLSHGGSLFVGVDQFMLGLEKNVG